MADQSKARSSRAHRAAKRYIYSWGGGSAEGSGAMRDLLGGKGAGLAEMARAGLPVPAGFTITTEACNDFFAADERVPEGLWDDVRAALGALEHETGKRFGDPAAPLLVSVRSGAKLSMPGMMDTVLNLGLNDATFAGLARLSGDERFAADAYRRFIQMFGRIVLGVPGERFERALEEKKAERGARDDAGLDAAALRELVATFERIVCEATGRPFPKDPLAQLELAIVAVFRSWFGQRARDYRKFHGIRDDLGTAVNVVAMVFGNLGETSGTGVVFTRDPNTGERTLYGEYLTNAQGEDVVAGIRTAPKIAAMREELPGPFTELTRVAAQLERRYRDVQDLEFTIERGRLYMLQTRAAKRTAAAAVKIAVDMVDEGLITKNEALLRVEPAQVEQLLRDQLDPAARASAVRVARGLNASPGAAVGRAVFDAGSAAAWAARGERVILVRLETSPDDFHGMAVAQGILTARGGATSHAAVVARQIGKPCVAGCAELAVDTACRRARAGAAEFGEGDWISIDGATGEVFFGELKTVPGSFDGQPALARLLGWADEVRRLEIWTNADEPAEAAEARRYGAQGIGLCRTEHMFRAGERLTIVRHAILVAHRATRAAERRAAGVELDAAEQAALERFERALKELERLQQGDFEGLFRAMDGLPVVVRLIDPPLHEFLPKHDEQLVKVTKARLDGGASREDEELLAAIEALREQNPMLGLRGCRLGLLVPAFVKMQTRAILNAQIAVKKAGGRPIAKIMIPLVGHAGELARTRALLEAEARAVEQAGGVRVDYSFGTMIEVPRAALTADELAREADFFSFGTNDLTQMTFGYCRDAAESGFLV
ncbi:MAG TPA: pyruvate, phosphate dikinase, partial [Gammaproteobacteria bacterium]|nr:pyruvate, phosphate dikinase [Gammaproteobacteria bacterium]